MQSMTAMNHFLKTMTMSKTKIIGMLFIINTIFQFELNAQENFERELILRMGPQLTKESTLFGMYMDNTSLHNGIGYDFEFGYSSNLKNKIWLNVGLGYVGSYNRYYSMYFTGIKFVEINFKILRFPLGFGIDVTKWLRINSGISFDYQVNNPNGQFFSNQTGFGVYINSDVSYEVLDDLRLMITPNLTHYAIKSLSKDTFNDRILSYGVLLGIAKRF